MTTTADDHALLREYRIEAHLNAQPLADSISDVQLSPEILEYLQSVGQDVEELLRKPAVTVPRVDDSLPLTHYLVSSSHNTYLLSRQLIGHSSAAAYTHVLSQNGRCVEIDAWPSKKGPIVTHGYTFTKSIPFRDVAVAIGEAITPNSWPVLVSLENHVPPSGQQELVDIMLEVWGDKLVQRALEGIDGDNVTPKDLTGRIVLMVEYYPPSLPASELAPGASTEDSERLAAEHEQAQEEGVDAEERSSIAEIRAKEAADAEAGISPKISPELAALGFYARSMKPGKGWYEQELNEPPHVLVNISEPGIRSLHNATTASSEPVLPLLIKSSTQHLRRVYPAGTRIFSANFDPLEFWRDGSQVACLNWQDYDKGAQVNAGLFVGSNGWVDKPRWMLGGKDMRMRMKDEEDKVRVKGEIVGVSSLTNPGSWNELGIYTKVQLLHTDGDQEWSTRVVSAAKGDHRANPMWNETFEWVVAKDELAFLRITVEESHISLMKHASLAVFTARIGHLKDGFHLIRLLDRKGRDSGATMLVNFSIGSASEVA